MYPKIDRIQTGHRLKQLMDKKNISVKQVQQFLNLSCVQSIYHWLDGTSMPTIDNLYALSELFQVPIDAMICGNRKNIRVMYIEDRQARILAYCVKLNEFRVA